VAGASTKEVADGFFQGIEGANPARFAKWGWLTQRPVEVDDPPLLVEPAHLRAPGPLAQLVVSVTGGGGDGDDEPMSKAPTLSPPPRPSLSNATTARPVAVRLAIEAAATMLPARPGTTAIEGSHLKKRKLQMPAAMFTLGAAARGPSSLPPAPPRPKEPPFAPTGKFWKSGGFDGLPLEVMDAAVCALNLFWR